MLDRKANEGDFDREAAGKARDWLVEANLPDLDTARTKIFSRYLKFQDDVELRQAYFELLKACGNPEPGVRVG